MSMNWKALSITIGIFIGIAALMWLCVAFNAFVIVLLSILVCVLVYVVYLAVKTSMELYDETKRQHKNTKK